MAMEGRLERLEDKIGNIREDQSAIKQNLALMGKALGKLADIRAETLHILRQQEQDQKDHDEIFSRLRLIENGRTACDEKYSAARTSCDVKHTTIKKSIDGLEGNQRWVVVLLLGTICSYVLENFSWQ